MKRVAGPTIGQSVYPGIGGAFDIFRVREYFDAITSARQIARRVREDAGLVSSLRRALVRTPLEPRTQPRGSRFWGPTPEGRRRKIGLAIAATGGSGAMASLVGVLRACEELGVVPRVMSFASGAALFALPIAAGKSAEETAQFILSIDPTDWVDPNWAQLLGMIPARGRGFAGLLKGSRIEASYRRFLGRVELGDLEIPSYAPVWNVEYNRLEYIGPRNHPHMEVAHAIRMAIALPLFVDPVRWKGGYWCDGGIVDIFPVHPILDIEGRCDLALVVNGFYPHDFAGELYAGWRRRPWSILELADQVVVAQHQELAREHLARLRSQIPTVISIEPVPYERVRRGGFYAQFLDHRDWPQFMRAGRRAALGALRHQVHATHGGRLPARLSA